jgi:hypothetical protein
MDGIKRAIDKYGGELTGMRDDDLELEFGKESFNADSIRPELWQFL